MNPCMMSHTIETAGTVNIACYGDRLNSFDGDGDLMHDFELGI